ncbi:MAG TPA: hypothetical protein VM429_00440 [Micropruina sp.]|nr:hypothetical protein [Micropruina sp.]
MVELSNEPGTRADVQALRAQAMLFTRPAAEIFSMLVTEAQLIEPYDTTRAATLFTRAASIGVTAADLAGAHQVAQLAARMAEPGINWSATMALAVVRANLGEVDAALALLKPLLQTSQWVPTLDEIMVLSGVAQSLAWMEQWSSARQVLDHIVGAARMAAAPAALIFPLAALAEFELRLGKVSAAYAAAAESVQLAAETGHASLSSFALVVLARVEAVLGHPDDSRAHIASALEFSRLVGSHSIEHYAASTLGLLELSSGHPDRAVRHLIDCERLERQLMAVYSARSGRPSRGRMLATITQWAADLVEALIRSGATTDAKRSLAVLEETCRRP